MTTPPDTTTTTTTDPCAAGRARPARASGGSGAARLVRLVVLALAGAVCVAAAAAHWAVLRIEAPQEYREPAIVLSTALLLDGRNPFGLPQQPVFANVYGIGYHLVAYPVARVMGPTFLAHRLVSAPCVVGAGALLGWALRRSGVGWALAAVAGAMLYADLSLRTSDIGVGGMPLSLYARPDALGLLLLLATLLVPWARGFSRGGLAASGLLAVGALLTKPYFVLGWPILSVYLLLFVSVHRAVAYAGGTGLAIAGAYAGAVALLPAYHANVVVGNLRAGVDVPGHAAAQFAEYVRLAPGTAALLAVAAVVGVRAAWASRPAGAPVRWAGWDAPLLTIPGSLTALAGLALACTTGALSLKLARHGGNSMLYLYQLLSPFVLIVVFRLIATARPARRAVLLVPVLLDLVLVLVHLPPLPQAHADVWAEWRALLARHANVYAPSPLSHVVYQQGKPVYESGLSDSTHYLADDAVYPPDHPIRARYAAHVADVARQTRDGSFDLVVLPYEDDEPFLTFVPTADLERHYRPVGVMDFPMDWQPGWTGVIWARKAAADP